MPAPAAADFVLGRIVSVFFFLLFPPKSLLLATYRAWLLLLAGTAIFAFSPTGTKDETFWKKSLALFLAACLDLLDTTNKHWPSGLDTTAVDDILFYPLPY